MSTPRWADGKKYREAAIREPPGVVQELESDTILRHQTLALGDQGAVS